MNKVHYTPALWRVNKKTERARGDETGVQSTGMKVEEWPGQISKVAPEWWDYNTLDREILADAARLRERDIRQLSREGFTVHVYETLEEFYLAEALE